MFRLEVNMAMWQSGRKPGKASKGSKHQKGQASLFCSKASKGSGLFVLQINDISKRPDPFDAQPTEHQAIETKNSNSEYDIDRSRFREL